MKGDCMVCGVGKCQTNHWVSDSLHTVYHLLKQFAREPGQAFERFPRGQVLVCEARVKRVVAVGAKHGVLLRGVALGGNPKVALRVDVFPNNGTRLGHLEQPPVGSLAHQEVATSEGLDAADVGAEERGVGAFGVDPRFLGGPKGFDVVDGIRSIFEQRRFPHVDCRAIASGSVVAVVVDHELVGLGMAFGNPLNIVLPIELLVLGITAAVGFWVAIAIQQVSSGPCRLF